MGPDPLLQLRRISLDPTEEGRVVDRDTAVLQHQFEIAVADREHQIPAHGPEDHLDRELPALELLALCHATCAAIRLSRRPVYPIRTRLTTLQQSLSPPLALAIPLMRVMSSHGKSGLVRRVLALDACVALLLLFDQALG